MLATNLKYINYINKIKKRGKMIYFTSDMHLCHKNICKYDNRPFSTVQEMNEVLIDNWNNTVKSNDIVYNLGDVIFSKNHSILNRLNGTKHYILGNHDKNPSWNGVHYKELSVKDKKFVLCHFPLLAWNRSRYGSIHLHGHLHSKTPITSNVRRYDVGVTANNYKPVSVDEIIETFKNMDMSDPEEIYPIGSKELIKY